MDQGYGSHRRYHPLYHFIVVPVFSVNVVLQFYNLWLWPSLHTGWHVVMSLALLLGLLLARYYPLRIQDRLIRLEETLRLARCLPPDLQPRIGELSTSQLIALRFCGDDQLPEITRAVLGGEIKGRDEIKRRITNWRADHRRI